jgi:hypothetical protein
MSINHIIKNIVPDDEKLDVKFGTVEADNIEVAGATFQNLTITNDLDVGNEVTIGSTAQIESIVVQNLNCEVGALFDHALVTDYLTVQGPLNANNIKARTSLFKSEPYFNSDALGVNTNTTAAQFVNGMLMFNDTAKTNFSFTCPGSGDLDNYLGLSGTDEYAFRTTANIFPTMSTASTLSIKCVLSTGVYINIAGNDTKALPHQVGQNESFTFITKRQSDGTYVIYG